MITRGRELSVILVPDYPFRSALFFCSSSSSSSGVLSFTNISMEEESDFDMR